MKKILSCLFLSSLLLTACGGSSAAPAQVSDSANPADKLLDNNIFSEATSGGNVKRCADILDATLKASCVQVVNDKKATDAAIAAVDTSLCGKVTNARYKQECERQVGVKVEARDLDAKIQSVDEESIKKMDPSLCDQITQENVRASCKYNVIIGLAMQKKDPSLCEGIGLKAFIDQCKSFFSVK